jgi:hypothetical protein
MCPWSGDFKKGDDVIAGAYYKKHGRSTDTYVFFDTSTVAHVDAHLVRACKFPMALVAHTVRGNNAVYRMSDDTKNVIHQALQEWWANE